MNDIKQLCRIALYSSLVGLILLILLGFNIYSRSWGNSANIGDFDFSDNSHIYIIFSMIRCLIAMYFGALLISCGVIGSILRFTIDNEKKFSHDRQTSSDSLPSILSIILGSLIIIISLIYKVNQS